MTTIVDVTTLSIVLNGYFEDSSFITGAQPTNDDFEVFNALPHAPSADKHPHLARWYKTIANTEAPAKCEHPACGCEVIKSNDKPEQENENKDEDEDFDLFGSDDEDSEAEEIKAKIVADYKAKKAQKGPLPAAKTTVVYHVKPWDIDTDLDELETKIRGIQMDGLVWGQVAKRTHVAFGIHRLEIYNVVEDEKVSVEDIVELIEGFVDHVQSVDIALMSKI
ncbi:Translation elongation factor 1 beta [Coemansia sp. RSA 678]|nr:Translation elongation factor 1 beta [Coemansia sp. RSA 678]